MKVKGDGYGVFQRDGKWWFKTYRNDDPVYGPFDLRSTAMERLLAALGFDVEEEAAIGRKEDLKP